MTVTIHIAGPNAEALAAELESFFAEALGTVPERRRPPDDRVSLTSGATPPLDLTTAGRDAVLDRLERPSDTD